MRTVFYAALAATAFADLWDEIDCNEKARCAILTTAASKCLTPCFREAQACFKLVGAMIPKIQQCMIDYDTLDFIEQPRRSDSCNVCIDSQMTRHCDNYLNDFIDKCGKEPEGEDDKDDGEQDPCMNLNQNNCKKWAGTCTWDLRDRYCVNNDMLLDSDDEGSVEDSTEDCPTCPEPRECECGLRGKTKKTNNSGSPSFTETSCECHDICNVDGNLGYTWVGPRNRKQEKKGGKCQCFTGSKKSSIRVGKASSTDFAHFYGY